MGPAFGSTLSLEWQDGCISCTKFLLAKRAKLMQAKDIADDKMDQNEKLAKLRAGVSLAKSEKQGITAIEVEE